MIHTALILIGLTISGMEAPAINAPQYVTTHPAEDYMPDLSRDGRLMVFVSNRAGPANIWIKTIGATEIQTPRRLTEGVAGEKSPRITADGKKMVYVSYGADSQGDLYLMSLAGVDKLVGFKPFPIRLTDISTLDKEPALSPNGRYVFYTSRNKNETVENLWVYDLQSGDKRKITVGGGSHATVSPDGKSVVFVSYRDRAKGALYLLDLKTNLITRLSRAKWTDSFPAYINDTTIVFTRYADDTTGDGQITLDDNPSLYRLNLAKPNAPALPLTTAQRYNLFPAVNQGMIYYSAKYGSFVDIFKIPVDGVSPGAGLVAKDIERAQSIEKFYGARPRLALLAWRVAWSVNHDSDDIKALAKALYNQGRIEIEMGESSQAEKTYSKLISLYRDEQIYTGLAKIKKALISFSNERVGSDVLMARLQEIIDNGAPRQVVARAKMEKASTLISEGQSDEGLKILRAIVDEYADIKAISAEASMRKNEVYTLTGDKEKQEAVYVEIIKNYPGQARWVDKAIGRLFELNLVPGDTKKSIANLTTLIGVYSHTPKLQAWAMNEVAKIYFEDNELIRARDTYAFAAKKYPHQRKAKNHALVRMAEIYAIEEKFGQALKIYSLVERDSELKQEEYEKIKAGFIKQSLKKGRYELKQNEPRLALKTFKAALKFDPHIVEAARGVVQSQVALGQARVAVEEFGKKAEEHPDSLINAYALGLAMTYLDPPDFSQALVLIKKAMVQDERNPWYHQTLGWLYEQKGRMENRPLFYELALQEYNYAYALTNVAAFPERVADLHLNLGNISFLLKDYAGARENYRLRAKAHLVFASLWAEALFYKRWGVAEYKLGEDTNALINYRRAMDITPQSDTPRIIELWERIGLAYQSLQDYQSAANSFMESLKLRRAMGDKSNETVILRNIANNLYFLSKTGDKNVGPAMRQALNFYTQSETALKGFKEKKDNDGLALITLQIETGVGGLKGASKGFSEMEEKKLIFHHIGQILGEMGDYESAIEFFEKKLRLSPSALSILDNVPVVTEKAIILNQLGFYQYKLGAYENSVARFMESNQLCIELKNANCLIINSDNLSIIALDRQNQISSKLLDKVIDSSLEALNIARNSETANAMDMAKALNHLAQLSHNRALVAMRVKTKKDVYGQVKTIKEIGRDIARGVRLYKEAATLYSKGASIDNARGQLNTSLNLATLYHDAGDIKSALQLLNDTLELSQTIGMDEIVWKAIYLKYLFDPANHPSALKQAIDTLEQTPFGRGVSDNPTQALAMIRTMYHTWALRASNDLEALTLIEKGVAMGIKLGLASLVTDELEDVQIPGIEKLATLLEKKTAIIEKRMAMVGNGREDKLDNQELGQWRKEYEQAIGEIKEANQILGDIAEPATFDLDSFALGLNNDERAIYFWRRDDGVKAFIVTPAGMETRIEKEEATLVASLPKVAKTYIVSERPFSDPIMEKLEQSGVVSFIPGFGALKHFINGRSLNDFRLLGMDEKSEKLWEISKTYPYASMITKANVAAMMKTEKLANAGVVALGKAIDIYPGNLLKSEAYLTDDKSVPRKITLKKLLQIHKGGALMVTPEMKSDNGRDWEGALSYLALLSGFPSWVVAPKDKLDDTYEALFSNGAPQLHNHLLTSNRGARLIGSFGYTYEEKLKVARGEFKKKTRAGMNAYKAKEWASAVGLLQGSLVYMKLAGADKYEPAILQRLADSQYAIGEFAKGLTSQEKLNHIYKLSGDKRKLAQSLLTTGIAETKLRRYEQAVNNIKASLKIFKAEGMVAQVPSTYSSLGRAEEKYTRYENALTAYNVALSLNREEGSLASQARELMRVGRIYHVRMGKYGDGRTAYEDAVSIYKKLEDNRMVTQGLVALGALEVDAGRLAQAGKILKEALQIATADGDNQSLALIWFHLANASWFRGEYEKAFHNIRESIKAAGADKALLGMAHNSLGLIYLTLNDYPRSLANLEKSLKMARETGSLLDEASALNNLGLLARKQGELEKSLAWFTKAKGIDEELKSDWGVAHSVRNMSVTHLRLGSVDRAETLIVEAISLSKKIGDKISLARANLQLADILSIKKKWDMAIEAYHLAKETAAGPKTVEIVWRALRGEGKAFAATGRRQRAITAYKQGVRLVERMRANIKTDFLKSGFLDDKQELYEELILLLLDEGDIDQAFSFSERARARGFIDMLGMARIKIKDKAVANEYEKAIELKRTINEIESASADGNAPQAIKKKYKIAIESLREKAPEVVSFITVEPISPARLYRLLGPEVALVEYVMAKDELVIFVIGAGEIKAFRQPVGKTKIAKLVEEYRTLISERGPIGEKGRELGKILIDPVLAQIKRFNVVGIVPHGALHYLSFASLKTEKGFLVDTMPIFYAPSAGTFEYTAQRRAGSSTFPPRVLALGNPNLGDADTDLPLSELEARSIRWTFENVDIYTRKEATKSVITKTAGEYRIVHIASHGQFDPVNPLNSSLRLAPDMDNDGALSASEVFGLAINADIVTLSACQTGLGMVTGGDEVIGMNRAFLFSGAHSILSTLWRVDDMASAILVKHFYRNLGKMEKAKALRKAQLNIKKRYPHPAMWAGFTLVGDYK